MQFIIALMLTYYSTVFWLSVYKTGQLRALQLALHIYIEALEIEETFEELDIQLQGVPRNMTVGE